MFIFKIGQIFKRIPNINKKDLFQILRLKTVVNKKAYFSLIEGQLSDAELPFYMGLSIIEDCFDPERSQMNTQWILLYDSMWVCPACRNFYLAEIRPNNLYLPCWLCSLEK